jgi:hypothetical protein
VVTNISEKPAASFFKTKVGYGGSRFLQNAAVHETAWSHNLEDHKLSNYQDNPTFSIPFINIYHTNL